MNYGEGGGLKLVLRAQPHPQFSKVVQNIMCMYSPKSIQKHNAELSKHRLEHQNPKVCFDLDFIAKNNAFLQTGSS